MRTPQIVAVLFAIAIGLNGANAQTSDSRLEGCLDPAVIATALEKIRDSEWSDLNIARVQAIWPRELYLDDCKGNTCTPALRSKVPEDRYDYCGEDFRFKNRPGTKIKEMGTFDVTLRALRKKEIIGSTLLMMQSIGVPGDELAIQGKHLKQDYSWDRSKYEHVWVTVDIRHDGHLWIAILLFSRFDDREFAQSPH